MNFLLLFLGGRIEHTLEIVGSDRRYLRYNRPRPHLVGQIVDRGLFEGEPALPVRLFGEGVVAWGAGGSAKFHGAIRRAHPVVPPTIPCYCLH